VGFTQGYSCLGVIISVASLFVLIVATLPAEKRFGKYRTYLVVISALMVSYTLVLWYLVSQMPGAFATMLRESDPAVAAVMLIVRQPVYWIFLLRLIWPRMKLEGR
jgi:Na+/melibiose symporter-like transporter